MFRSLRQVKAVVAISFVFLFLFQAFLPDMDIACEMKKLPTLFQRFYEHKAEDGNGFAAFLREGYLHDHRTDPCREEGENREDLPFHKHRHCCSAPVFCFMEYSTSPPEKAVFDIVLLDRYRLACYSVDRESLLRPPRV